LADIFREIDEDLRRDRMVKLWQRYGRFVIGAAVLIVVATAAVVAWRDWQRRQDEALGLQYAQATALAQTDAAKAVNEFGKLAADGGTGYATLARLEAAVLKTKGSDKAGGLAALQTIAADGGVEQPYRNLAAILAAFYGVDDEPTAEFVSRLQPLTSVQSPWRFSALELTALSQLKSGDKPAALKSYQQLADDLEAPQSLRARATEIVAALSH
jgi:hypothetical protein